MLLPFSHVKSFREATEQELAETKLYKRSLVEYGKSMGQAVIFLETSFNHHTVPHAKMEVLFGDSELLEQAAIFFTKGFSEIDGEWSSHKKVIQITKKQGGLLKQIPASKCLLIETFLTCKWNGTKTRVWFTSSRKRINSTEGSYT